MAAAAELSEDRLTRYRIFTTFNEKGDDAPIAVFNFDKTLIPFSLSTLINLSRRVNESASFAIPEAADSEDPGRVDKPVPFTVHEATESKGYDKAIRALLTTLSQDYKIIICCSYNTDMAAVKDVLDQLGLSGHVDAIVLRFDICDPSNTYQMCKAAGIDVAKVRLLVGIDTDSLKTFLENKAGSPLVTVEPALGTITTHIGKHGDFPDCVKACVAALRPSVANSSGAARPTTPMFNATTGAGESPDTGKRTCPP